MAEGFEVFLRQHYLDQVPGSAALPRRPLSLCPALRDWLAPRIDGKLGCFARSVKPAKIRRKSGRWCSPVGTARCAVRAAFSGASGEARNTCGGRESFRPLLRVRGHRSAMSLPPNQDTIKIRFRKFYEAKAGQTNLGCSIFPGLRKDRDELIYGGPEKFNQSKGV